MRDSMFVPAEDFDGKPAGEVEIRVPARPWVIEQHTNLDKSFRILCAHGGTVCYIDNDDVDTREAQLTAEFIVELANRFGVPGGAQLTIDDEAAAAH